MTDDDPFAGLRRELRATGNSPEAIEAFVAEAKELHNKLVRSNPQAAERIRTGCWSYGSLEGKPYSYCPDMPDEGATIH